jgi:hypothetical protein
MASICAACAVAVVRTKWAMVKVIVTQGLRDLIPLARELLVRDVALTKAAARAAFADELDLPAVH